MRFLSLYVPPGDHDRVISSLAAALVLDDIPLFSAGDANLQLQQPREGEEDAVTALRSLLASRGSVLVDYAGLSYFGRERGSSIDFASVPADGAWRWHAQVQRRNGLSDHGCLLLGNSARPVSAARALTPATFRSLPAEARDDLRRRFVLLEYTFAIPPAELHAPPTEGGEPCGLPLEEGCLPLDHPPSRSWRRIPPPSPFPLPGGLPPDPSDPRPPAAGTHAFRTCCSVGRRCQLVARLALQTPPAQPRRDAGRGHSRPRALHPLGTVGGLAVLAGLGRHPSGTRRSPRLACHVERGAAAVSCCFSAAVGARPRGVPAGTT